jgi:ketosteroid isomerase-like protein
MSQENVELVRRAFDAWNRNDWATLERCHDPEVTIVAPDGWPEADDARGWEATRQQYERLKDAWGVERSEIDGIRVVDEQVVLVRFRWITSGRASGVEQEWPMANVATVRDGRFAEIRYFLDPAEALRAAGLSD